MDPEYDDLLEDVRQKINQIKEDTAQLLSEQPDVPEKELPPGNLPNSNLKETAANVTLAFRHLEDARMRLGKAIQAYNGGVSCYDKK
mgnify:CR=1 FL=1